MILKDKVFNLFVSNTTIFEIIVTEGAGCLLYYLFKSTQVTFMTEKNQVLNIKKKIEIIYSPETERKLMRTVLDFFYFIAFFFDR